MWAARGWLGGISGRPRGVPETLPDAYGALKFFAGQPHIYPQYIGIPAAAKSFVSHKVYAQATHGWDRLTPAITVTDPFSHLGQGGPVDFVPNPEVALTSRSTAVLFFQQAFGLEVAASGRCS